MRSDERYVSITKVHPHKGINGWVFRWRARRALNRARRAPGNLFAELYRKKDTLYALTVWDNAPALKRFARTTAQAKTLLQFRDMSHGLTYGFLSDGVPSWPEAMALCDRHGTLFGRPDPAESQDAKSSD